MRANFETLYVQAMRDTNTMRDHITTLEEVLRETRYYVQITWGSERAAELLVRINRLLGDA